jgi:hypothetical protein
MTATLIEVESTAIRSVAWAGGTLSVEFLNGRLYDYSNVPYSVFEELILADSKGEFYNQNIRGRYQ